MTPNTLILASSSPRRKEILDSLGVPYEAYSPDVEELDASDMTPHAMVKANAELKARAIAQKFPNQFILAADTTVTLNGTAFGKPGDLDEAKHFLRLLSAQTHQVLTGVCLHQQVQEIHEVYVESSDVTFRELNDSLIDSYFERVNPLDKAGAYGIQNYAMMLICSFSGSLSNIVGLPKESLTEYLQKYHIIHQNA